MHELARRLSNYLISVGVFPRTGAEPGRLATFEAKLGTSLPRGLGDVWLSADGMDPGVYDGNNVRFWPLDEWEIIDVASSADSRRVLVFADYSLNAHEYGIFLGAAENSVVILGGDTPIHVADSFAMFLGRYLDDALSIFPKPLSLNRSKE
jgi:hypothetical protein